MDTGTPSPHRQPIIDLFNGKQPERTPVWLMRQAGRYLPEYRKVREQAGGFLSLCYTPDLAVEVTMQPIRRFDFDAAILFSDILVLPNALGQHVWFAEGEGPRLDPITSADGLKTLQRDRTHTLTSKIFESVSGIRNQLAPDKSLIGFCGAPWTVATYMVAGRGTKDHAPARAWAFEDPRGFAQLIDIVTDASIDYLTGQIEAGADLLQIFDSWAGVLPDDQFERWVVEPTEKIVSAIKKSHPHTPIIGFPRLAGMNTVRYIQQTGVDGVGCDTSLPLSAMAGDIAASGAVVQGNLDPLLLVAGGQQLTDRVTATLDAMAGKPHIFNLGHGIVPHTPPEHVEALVQAVRSHQAKAA